MSPLVSIIVPVYNSEEYIFNSINSILNQTYKNIEIIIINDGSTDRTNEILNEIALKDKRIVYVNQKNIGVSETRNKGIQLSKGEYITFMDSDDTVEPEYIEKLIEEVLKNEFDIVACGYTDISKYGIVKLNDFYINNTILSKDEFIKRILNGVGGTVWGKIFRRNIIIENNIKMKQNIYMCEDMIFVLEYAMKCNKYGAINEKLYNYNRLNENSISAMVNMQYYNNLIVVISEIQKILEENNYEKSYVDSILCNRVQSMSISFLIMQHDKKHNYSKKQKIENIKIILNNKYNNLYKSKFVGKALRDKLMISLIKKNDVKYLNYYSMLLYNIQTIKDKVRGLS